MEVLGSLPNPIQPMRTTATDAKLECALGELKVEEDLQRRCRGATPLPAMAPQQDSGHEEDDTPQAEKGKTNKGENGKRRGRNDLKNSY